MRNFDRCPEKYCFNWEEKGWKSARGVHENVEAAFSKLESVRESGCSWTLGVCVRHPKQPGKGTKDFYEPYEPNLKHDGIEEDHFMRSKN